MDRKNLIFTPGAKVRFRRSNRVPWETGEIQYIKFDGVFIKNYGFIDKEYIQGIPIKPGPGIQKGIKFEHELQIYKLLTS